MRLSSLLKTATVTGATLLGLVVAPATTASASPATFVPCASGGAGLVAAITAANVAGGTINLAAWCTYSLTSPNLPINPNPQIGANGLPAVKNQVTINGFNTTISGNPASATPFRIFEVDGPGGNLTLQGLTITGGSSSSIGGAIVNNAGTVTLNHSQVTGNAAVDAGGGIASGNLGKSTALLGTLTLNFSKVNNNTVSGAPMQPNSGGGIVDKSSTVVLNGSQVNWNTAAGSAGGISNVGGAVSLNFSQVNNNTSQNGGGGIASGNGMGGVSPPPLGSLNLFFSQVDNNTSNGGPMAGAGGIANGGTATISLSQVNGNSAPGASGGGILNHGTMTVNLSQVNNNTVPSDGHGDLGFGGGIANLDFTTVLMPPPVASGVLTINLSQVSNNSASGFGGGIVESDATGTAPGSALGLNGSLVTGNSAPGGGGGIYAIAGSPVALKVTLVVKNAPDNCEPLNTIGGCFN